MAYHQTTLAALRAALQVRWDQTPFWTEEEATAALNEAVQVFGLSTGFFREPLDVPALGAYVVLPAPLAVGTRVRYLSSTLLPSSFFDLDEGMGASWEDAVGDPRIWVPISPLLIAVTPHPATAYTLMVDGLIRVPRLNAEGDYVALGDEEQGAVLDYALHKCLVKMGPSFLAESAMALDRFRRACALRNAQLLKAHIFRAATGRAEQWLNNVRIPGGFDDRPAAAE